MKKLFLIALSAVAVSFTFQSTVMAQAAGGNGIRFGIKAGANLTKTGDFRVGNEYFKSDYKPGFNAGIYADLPLGSGFAFLPEATFSQKGSKVDGSIGNTTGEINTTINYLDIPFMIGFQAAPALTVFAGPQVSFLLSQKTKIYSNGQQLGDTDTDNDNFRKSLAGGAVGLGYRVGDNLNINARYMMDFQEAGVEDLQQDKYKNSGFALSLGYSF